MILYFTQQKCIMVLNLKKFLVSPKFSQCHPCLKKRGLSFLESLNHLLYYVLIKFINLAPMYIKVRNHISWVIGCLHIILMTLKK